MIQKNTVAEPPKGRKITVIYAVILLAHCLFIFLPLWYFEMRQPKQKTNLFRVKLGPAELSSGPRVGPPERTRQISRPAPSEPEISVPQPKPVAEPQFVPPKPKLVKKVVPKKTIQSKKSAVKPNPKSVVKPFKKVMPPKQKKLVKPKRNKKDGVFQGGPQEPFIKNPNIPAGNTNRAQTWGKKFDGRTPGGGAEINLARYGETLHKYINLKWKAPSQSHIGDTRPETVVEFTISASGKVLASRIVTPSRSPAMEESVKALLSQLDLLPRPPMRPGQKVLEFQLVLKTK